MVDPETIRMLVELMTANDLAEISLRDGEEEIHLKRGVDAEARPGLPAMMMYPPQMSMMMPPAPSSPASPAGAAGEVPAAPAAVDEDAGLVPIKSPMVGTYYEAPEPQAPAFVSIGAKVSAQTVVCIIEAMKVFNEIKAGVSGTIARVIVKNEAPVEFGQTLFLVRPD